MESRKNSCLAVKSYSKKIILSLRGFHSKSQQIILCDDYTHAEVIETDSLIRAGPECSGRAHPLYVHDHSYLQIKMSGVGSDQCESNHLCAPEILGTTTKHRVDNTDVVQATSYVCLESLITQEDIKHLHRKPNFDYSFQVQCLLFFKCLGEESPDRILLGIKKE